MQAFPLSAPFLFLCSIAVIYVILDLDHKERKEALIVDDLGHSDLVALVGALFRKIPGVSEVADQLISEYKVNEIDYSDDRQYGYRYLQNSKPSRFRNIYRSNNPQRLLSFHIAPTINLTCIANMQS